MPNAVNHDASLLAFAAETGTKQTPDLHNLNRRGVKVIVDITVISAGTFTVTIQGKDPTSGKVWTLLVSTGLAAPGTTILTVYPGLVVAANASANDVLPATWNVKAVSAGGLVTATIACSEIL